MNNKTQHFKNCLGVFQGGGCKALAFIGAYKEAMNRGVFFSRVAGTSAGALVAALIAAGARPEQLEVLIGTTDFAKFKQRPDPVQVPLDAGISRHFLRFGKRNHRLVASFMSNLGLFSSSKIEEWVEARLKELLQFTDSRKVQFRDLNIPLHVVATDLKEAKPKVWSSDTTPDASVSYAVRCSCTIPIYFQAVDSILVDGGIVSNLPSFALTQHRKTFEKMLCFTFSSSGNSPDNPATSFLSSTALRESPLIEDYLVSLISAAIDGAVHIQTELQPNLHVIEIGRLPLGTLDFDKIDKKTAERMFEAGQEAAKRFFDTEVSHLKGNPISRKILFTDAEALNEMVREELHNGDEVLVSIKNTRYVYTLFPTLLHWRMAGVKVLFFTEPIRESGDKEKHERFRRLVLRTLGVGTREVPSLPLEGIIFKKQSVAYGAIIFNPNRSEKRSACFGVRYEKTYDTDAIEAITSRLLSCLPQSTVLSEPVVVALQLKKSGTDRLFNSLRRVEQYASPRVQFSLEEVDVEKIVFLTKYVKSYKYNQIERLLELFARQGIELFDCAHIEYGTPFSEIFMPVTPPVAERHGDMHFLIEGNSRLTYLIKERKLSKVRIVVVRNVETPLPTTGRFSSAQLLISDEGRTGDERYEKFDFSLFRVIEEAVRHPDIYAEYYHE